jgi:hypothetical protein
MIRELGAADPAAELRIALAEFTGDPVTVETEDATHPVECDADVPLTVLLVQRAGERVHDAVHDSPLPTSTGVTVGASTHSVNFWCNQRIFAS